jgi:cell division protein FtsN
VASVPASPPSSAPAPSAAGSAPASASPATTATGRWTVYANPTRDLLAAEHERAALRAKGYAAEVVTLRRDGDLWYRIRVGRYATEAQAEDAARRLRSDGSAHGFVQSE